MTFRNSILAGTTLVREDIRSENFVRGVSGWIIERDGDAEFNDAVFRGTVEVGGGEPPDSALVVKYYLDSVANGTTISTSTVGTGDTNPSSIQGIAPTVDATEDRTRISYNQGDPISDASYLVFDHSDNTTLDYRWYLQYNTLGGGFRSMTLWSLTDNNTFANIDINFAGNLVFSDAGGTTGTSSTALSADTVYRVTFSRDGLEYIVKLYLGESGTPLEILTLTANNLRPIEQLWVGNTNNAGSQVLFKQGFIGISEFPGAFEPSTVTISDERAAILLSTGDTNELTEAIIEAIRTTSDAQLKLSGPDFSTVTANLPATLSLGEQFSPQASTIEGTADYIELATQNTRLVLDDIGVNETAVLAGDDSVSLQTDTRSASLGESSGLFQILNADLNLILGGIVASVMRPIQSENSGNETVTNGSPFQAATNGAGHTFVAPPSGIIRVDVGAEFIMELTANVNRRVFGAFQIRTGTTVGSGTLVHAASLNDSVVTGVGNASNDRVAHASTRSKIVSGLTAGADYNIEYQHRLDSAGSVTCTELHREIITTPQP